MDNTNYHKEILKNNYLYNVELNQVKKLWKAKRTQESLEVIANLANFVWNNYSGLHSSAQLEGLLAEISAAYIKKDVQVKRKGSGEVKRVLHVATRLYETGGHTPLMLKWMQRDSNRQHDLFLTQQSSADLPGKQFDKHGFSKSNIIFTRDDNENSLDIATILYNSSIDYDLVVLHIHPDDVIPNLAFANHKHTPVYVMNHADHCFWLGASIADGLVQIRETNYEIDAERRGIPLQKQFYLPIPVEAVEHEKHERSQIISELGLEKYSTILLSTSGENKFVFFNDYNYYESIIPVLDKNPQTVLLVVGVGPESWMAQKYRHPQIKFMGVLLPAELAKIEAAADIYVENLPYSSFTALLQMFMRKKATHFVYAPLSITQLFKDESVYTKNNGEWQQVLNRLINDTEFRQKRTEDFYNRNYSVYTLSTWREKLELIYASLNNLTPAYNTIASTAIDNITDNEILLYKLLRQRYIYNFFKKSPLLFITRWINFMMLNSKGLKMKKNY